MCIRTKLKAYVWTLAACFSLQVLADPTPLPTPIGALAAGFNHACAVQRYTNTTTNALWEQVVCWGDNSYGELGSKTGVSTLTGIVQSTPTPVQSPLQFGGPPVLVGPAGTVIKQLAAGNFFTCALKYNGSVWCWGDDTWGVIGLDPFSTNQASIVANLSWPEFGDVVYPQQIDFSLVTKNPIIRITAGGAFACAIDSAGAVFCWGDNRNDQLEVPNSFFSYSAKPGRAGHLITPVIDIAAGVDFVCALDSSTDSNDGQFWCWGNGSHGSLGDANPNHVGNVYIPVQGAIPGLGRAMFSGSLAATFHSACLLDTNGTDWCWGEGTSGQLGGGPIQYPGSGTDVPTPVIASAPFLYIWGGSMATPNCATNASGLYCSNAADWYFDKVNPFAASSKSSIFVTTDYATPTAVSSGGEFQCAVDDISRILGKTRSTSQHVVCWGDDRSGQLGNSVPVGTVQSTLSVVL